MKRKRKDIFKQETIDSYSNKVKLQGLIRLNCGDSSEYNSKVKSYRNSITLELNERLPDGMFVFSSKFLLNPAEIYVYDESCEDMLIDVIKEQILPVKMRATYLDCKRVIGLIKDLEKDLRHIPEDILDTKLDTFKKMEYIERTVFE
ncbi:hypothetical protein ABDJ34_07945 [Finegoldia dalianensis]|uniref:Uncharacterized protein n=1 Tax=Finegoldia dalianensis TaxID=3145239 RepID=A0ABW9KDQ8_9FIRM